jgi:hypothetical protein
LFHLLAPNSGEQSEVLRLSGTEIEAIKTRRGDDGGDECTESGVPSRNGGWRVAGGFVLETTLDCANWGTDALSCSRSCHSKRAIDKPGPYSILKLHKVPNGQLILH